MRAGNVTNVVCISHRPRVSKARTAGADQQFAWLRLITQL
jgi:hypothetical protein